jgi:hypothetical protein
MSMQCMNNRLTLLEVRGTTPKEEDMEVVEDMKVKEDTEAKEGVEEHSVVCLHYVNNELCDESQQ